MFSTPNPCYPTLLKHRVQELGRKYLSPGLNIWILRITMDAIAILNQNLNLYSQRSLNEPDDHGGQGGSHLRSNPIYAIVYMSIRTDDIRTQGYMGTAQTDGVDGPLPAQRSAQILKQDSQLVPGHSKAVEMVNALPSLSEDCDFMIHGEVPTDRVSAPERSSHSLNILHQ